MCKFDIKISYIQDDHKWKDIGGVKSIVNK